MTTIADLNRSLNRALSDIGQVKAAIRQLGDRVDNKPTGTGTTTITSGTTIHGSLTGLGLDDHMNLVHISNARTITAQHDFAPGSTQAPFTLGVNAQDQLVTGLNADKLDGIDSTGFEIIATKAANLIHAGPTSGGAANPTYRSMVEDDLAQHSIISKHTVSGSVDQVVGLTGTTVLALLTPSDNPGAAKAILKTTTGGLLTLLDLDVSNDFNVNSTVFKVNGGLSRVSINKSSPGAYDLDINDKLNVGGITTIANDLVVNTNNLIVDVSQNNVGVNKLPTAGYDLDVNTTLRTGGLATLGSLSVTGTAYFGNDLTVGPNILFVDYSGQRIGIKRAADPQFQLDILGNLRASGWIVGKHAVQLEGATGIFHFDGAEPYESDYTGVSTGHKGQKPLTETAIIYRFGKFGKAIQSAVATTNLVINSSWEDGLTSWTNWGSPTTREVVTAESYYGDSSLHLITSGNNQGVYQNASITSGQTYNLSIYTKVETGRSVLMLDATHGSSVYVSGAEWTGDGEWHRMHIRFTAAASSLNFFVGKSGSGEVGEYFFDACQLELYGSITPYCDGSLGAGHLWSGAAHASSSSRIESILEYDTGLAKANRGTFMCWVKFQDDAIHSPVYEYIAELTASAGSIMCLHTIGSDVIRLQIGSSASNGSIAVDGGWHHIAIVWDGTDGLLYLDGTLDITLLSYAGFSGDFTDIDIGNRQAHDRAMNGWIDEVAFLDRVADADEIVSVYESSAPVFAETSTFAWSTPSITTWVDEEGLWSRGAISGQEVFGISDVNSKSWAGLTLDEGDVVIGNSPNYLQWDDSNSRLIVTGKILATQGNMVGGTIFSESFQDSTSIADWYNWAGSGEMSIQAGGVFGGNFLRVGDNSGDDMVAMSHIVNIPYDPTKTYKVSFRVRRTSGVGKVYAGVMGVANDGVTLVNKTGSDTYSSQHYVSASNQAPGSSWTEYDGWLTGNAATGTNGTPGDPTNPGTLHEDAKYIRPYVYMNFPSVAGITELDAAIIEITPEGSDLTTIDGGRIVANSITTDELSATAIDGMTITGATLRTSSSGARVEMNSTRIFGTDGSTVQWEALNADGVFKAGAGNVVLDEDGMEILAVDGVASDPASVVEWFERGVPTNSIMYLEGYYNSSLGHYEGRLQVDAYLDTARSSYDASLYLMASSEGESNVILNANHKQTLAEARLVLHAEDATSARAVMSGEDFDGLIIHTGTPPTSDTPDALLDVRVSGNGEGIKADSAFIGRGGRGSSYAQFSHWSYRNAVGSYAIIQNSSGATLINAATGQQIKARINNSDIMTMDASAINPLVSLGTAWAGVSFGTSWSDYGSGFQACQYKKVGDLVFLRGVANSGAASWTTYPTIGTLPAGYRPASNLRLAADGNGAHVRIDILTTGAIYYMAGGSGSGRISLDSIVFSVD